MGGVVGSWGAWATLPLAHQQQLLPEASSKIKKDTCVFAAQQVARQLLGHTYLLAVDSSSLLAHAGAACAAVSKAPCSIINE